MEFLKMIGKNLPAIISTVAALAAWVPFAITHISIKRRKISATVVDYRIIESAIVSDSRRENELQGTILILAMNCFVSEKSLYAEDYKIEISINKNTKATGLIFDGLIEEYIADKAKTLAIPTDYNFNLHREFVHDKDNIRVFPLFFNNVSFQEIKSVDSIKFELIGNKETKNFIIKQEDIPIYNKMGFISSLMK